MRYCQKCILPDTRPNLVIGSDGVCVACKTSVQKETAIDWQARERAFAAVVESVRSKKSGYDCLIPVSGGKDSTWQVVTCLKYELKPLAVTFKVAGRNPLGQKNLDNLVRLGVDHIDFQVDPSVEAKFMLTSLKKYAATGIPMHMGMHAITPRVAAMFRIPLIVWGENSAFEYGTSDEALTGFALDKEWLVRYGNTQGTHAQEWVGEEGLTLRDLEGYRMPSLESIEQSGIRAVFLGYYFPWDVENSLRVAQSYGFQVRKEGPKMGLYNYADIDDDFMSIHHWPKWHKFGFTRLFDNLSLEIRNGRMTRDQALAVLKEKGDQRPDEDIEKFCSFVGITVAEFDGICEKFRNKEIWYQDKGVWKIRDFIIKDWSWR